MSKLNVKVTGPFMDIYHYLRDNGYGIQEAKLKAKQQPSSLDFETFDEFVECVKHFHRPPFIVESDCDFEYDMTGVVGAYVPSEEEIEFQKVFTDEMHLSNVETIKAIVYWQTSGNVHPLTCGNNSSHQPLLPAINTDTNEVVLACFDCNYVQEVIPECVLSYYNEKIKNKEDEQVQD